MCLCSMCVSVCLGVYSPGLYQAIPDGLQLASRLVTGDSWCFGGNSVIVTGSAHVAGVKTCCLFGLLSQSYRPLAHTYINTYSMFHMHIRTFGLFHKHAQTCKQIQPFMWSRSSAEGALVHNPPLSVHY